MIKRSTVRELTDMGRLAPARVFAPPTVDTLRDFTIRAGDFKEEETAALIDTPTITGDALSHYRDNMPRRAAIPGVCPPPRSLTHIISRSDFGNERMDAVALDGKTDRQIRRMAVQDFREGKISVITQCELATEGWGLYRAFTAGFSCARPRALGMWIQMMGRCSRTAPGKERAILLDHVGELPALGGYPMRSAIGS